MSSTNSSANSLELDHASHDGDAVFAIERRGYPEDKKKTQPWKEMGLNVTDEGGPLVNQGPGMFRSAWKMVLVACSRIHDMGTGGLGGH